MGVLGGDMGVLGSYRGEILIGGEMGVLGSDMRVLRGDMGVFGVT